MKSQKPLSRRQTAKLALSTALPLGLFAGQGMAADDKKKKASGDAAEPQFLFVQNSKDVTFADGKMTMKGINPTTIFFSDRPERIAGHETTRDFIKSWSKGDDNFKIDNPNATLSTIGKDGDAVDIVVTLSNPVLEKGSLTYDVKILEGKAPESAGASSLFIDIVGRPLTPVSVAGVARRTTRRVCYRR